MGNKTPLYNSRITNTYLEYLSSHYPELDIPPMLAYAGIENYLHTPGLKTMKWKTLLTG